MDMSLDQSATPTRRFWRTWRREIIRGAVLFILVICGGLGLRAVFHNVKAHIPESLGSLGSFGDFNWGDGEGGDLFGRGREVGDPWEYRVLLKRTQHLWIRNTNGPIDVVAGTGDSLVIRVEKSWRTSDPQTVQLVPVLTERGVTICAMWEAREQRCDDGGDYRLNGVKKNDIAVRFTVQVPRNVPINASTVNGGLDIDGVSAPVEAKTCMWSGRRAHPDDLCVCVLTGIPFHFEFAASGEQPYLQPLGDLLHGVRRTADAPDRWEDIAFKTSTALRGSRCRVETAHISPDKRHLAICSEVRTLLGLRVHQAGLLYSIEEGSIVGRIAMGKRTPKGWIGAGS